MSKEIIEKIEELQNFLASDLWYSFEEEFKSEVDLRKYLHDHFNILYKQISDLSGSAK